MNMNDINLIVNHGVETFREGVAKKYQNPEGGLNAKGRAHFKRTEGANLKPPVSKKAAKKSPKKAGRRKSFCSRMGGQKRMHNIDCRANPDKDICKSLRKWDCNESYVDVLEALLEAELPPAQQQGQAAQQQGQAAQQQGQAAQQQGQAAQQQGQAAQQQGQAVNNRIKAMIRMINITHNANVPETEAGYNQLGRSTGIIQMLSKPSQFNMLLEKGIVKLDQKQMTDIITNFISTINK